MILITIVDQPIRFSNLTQLNFSYCNNHGSVLFSEVGLFTAWALSKIDRSKFTITTSSILPVDPSRTCGAHPNRKNMFFFNNASLMPAL